MSTTREGNRVRTIERARAALTCIEQHPRPSVDVLGWARDQLNITHNHADTHTTPPTPQQTHSRPVADALS